MSRRIDVESINSMIFNINLTSIRRLINNRFLLELTIYYHKE